MKPLHLRFIGIFLLSFATLLLEISLTRVLSVALWYHFGFLVISTALLGFGASGTILSVWKKIRVDIPLDKAMTLISLGFAVTTIISFWLMQKIPFAPFSLMSDPWQFLFMPLYFFIIAVPFFWSGLGISLLLTRGAEEVNRYYAWDLVGAALGCIAVILVLPTVGGAGAIFTAGAGGAIAALIFSLNENKRFMLPSGTLGVILLVCATFADSIIPITITPNKGRSRSEAVPEYSAWNTFSKVDLYAFGVDEETGVPRGKSFIIDYGTAATGNRNMSSIVDNFKNGLPASDTLYMREAGLSILGKESPHVLVIGSGAGADIYSALEMGASKVTAIEINPIINKIVRTDPFFKPLIDLPQVELYTDEGRSFIRRSTDQYDAIVANHTITNAAMASGALSLSESYILTKEAFEDYFDHLTEDGTILFTRPEYQIPRLFTTIREIFEDRNMGDPSNHLYAWRFPPRTPGDMSFVAGILMKKTAFNASDISLLDQTIFQSESDPNDRAEILYTPLGAPTHDSLVMGQQTDLSIFHEILDADDLSAFYLTKQAKLDPATDNQPFFNHRTRWSSIGWSTIGDLFQQDRRGRMALEDQPISEVTLIVLLLQVAFIAILFILMPLLRLPKLGQAIPHAGSFLLYFAGLGLGFILIEIVFIQRFTLYLGQPVYTLAGVLAGILLFTGLGAYYGDRFKETPIQSLRKIIPVLLLVLTFMSIITPYIFQWTLSWPIGAKILMTEMMLAPIGFMLGLPFPVGLRIVNKEAPSLVPWAWGVNGFFTVIGSILSVILGMTFGFVTVIIIAGICYLVCWLIVGRIQSSVSNA